MGLPAPLIATLLWLCPLQTTATPPPPQATPQANPAPAPPAQGVVEEVVFEGSKRMSDEALRLQVRTQKGKPYSAKTIDDDIKTLARFLVWTKDVRPERLPGGGLRVVFKLVDIATVRHVRFIGNQALGEDDLRKALGLSENGMIPVPTPNGYGLRVLVRKLESKYEEEGYLHVELDARPEKEGDDFVLVFRITEGPKVHVDHVDFVGWHDFTPAFSSFWSHPLRALMKTSRSFWFFTSTYKPEMLKEDVFQIEQFLQDEGFLNARVAVESVTSNARGDSVDILIRVEQGERYVVRSIKLEGNQHFSSQELLDAELIKLQPGMYYRQTLWKKDRDRLLKYYGHRGYVDCLVPLRPAETWAPDRPEVDLTIHVTEDEPKRVHDVRVVGNKTTRDEVVRRELDLHPGELFDTDEVDSALDRLRALEYFTDEHRSPHVWIDTEKTDDPKSKDAVMKVDEGGNGIFNLFGGLASGRGVFAGVDLTLINFDATDMPESWNRLFSDFADQRALHGDGEQLHLRANPGNRYSNYLVEFTDPYLNGPQIDRLFLNANLHLNEYLSRFYDEERAGGTVTVGKWLSRNANVSLGVRSDRVNITHILEDSPPIEDLEQVEGGNTVRALMGDFSWAHYDSLRYPTRGQKVDLETELVGGGLGGDADAWKASVSGEWLIPVWENEEQQRQVFSTRGAVAVAGAFWDSPNVPFFERYFAGGPGGLLQMRGFAWRGVGPHDRDFSQGGTHGWVLNHEYVFPLVDYYDARLRENTPFLRGLVFVDHGMLAGGWEELFEDRWRLSAGVGIRLRIPIAILALPLELYYGIPLQRTRYDERESFQINLFTRF